MRAELLYNPLLLIERLGHWATEKRRLRALRRTCAADLRTGHIDSIELLQLLRPLNPKIIYDIGANRGTWTLLTKAVYPLAEVHAFEPIPMHIKEFLRSTKGQARVHLHEIGLGPRSTRTPIKVTSFSDASSVLALTDTGKKQWNLQQLDEFPIQIEPLDAWISCRGLPVPDLIKLDVQGFELEVLKGAERCLTQAKAIISEISFRNFYEGQCRFDELVSWLADAGFFIYAFGHGTALGCALVQADILFLRQDVAGITDLAAPRP